MWDAPLRHTDFQILSGAISCGSFFNESIDNMNIFARSCMGSGPLWFRCLPRPHHAIGGPGPHLAMDGRTSVHAIASGILPGCCWEAPSPPPGKLLARWGPGPTIQLLVYTSSSPGPTHQGDFVEFGEQVLCRSDGKKTLFLSCRIVHYKTAVRVHVRHTPRT